MGNKRWMLFVAVLLAAGGTFMFALAGPAGAVPELSFHDVWARAASEGHTSAIYMTVVNTGTDPVAIVAARSDAAERVEVHETVMEVTFEGGRISQIMRMEEIDTLEIPPGGTVELKPGGLHIMLLGVTRDIESGDHFDVELELADGRRVVVDVAVKIGSEDDDHDHHDH